MCVAPQAFAGRGGQPTSRGCRSWLSGSGLCQNALVTQRLLCSILTGCMHWRVLSKSDDCWMSPLHGLLHMIGSPSRSRVQHNWGTASHRAWELDSTSLATRTARKQASISKTPPQARFTAAPLGCARTANHFFKKCMASCLGAHQPTVINDILCGLLQQSFASAGYNSAL